MSSAVTVTGELAADAELRFTAGTAPRALLLFRITAPAGYPFAVTQDCGADPANFAAAQAKSRLLRRGATVTVYAKGAFPRTDHGHAVLCLEGVSDVIPSSINPWEPRHAQ